MAELALGAGNFSAIRNVKCALAIETNVDMILVLPKRVGTGNGGNTGGTSVETDVTVTTLGIHSSYIANESTIATIYQRRTAIDGEATVTTSRASTGIADNDALNNGIRTNGLIAAKNQWSCLYHLPKSQRGSKQRAGINQLIIIFHIRSSWKHCRGQPLKWLRLLARLCCPGLEFIEKPANPGRHEKQRR